VLSVGGKSQYVLGLRNCIPRIDEFGEPFLCIYRSWRGNGEYYAMAALQFLISFFDRYKYFRLILERNPFKPQTPILQLFEHVRSKF